MEHNTNKDAELIRDIAHALWRSKLRSKLKTLDACRLAARDIVTHLRRCRYAVESGPGLSPHAAVSGPAGRPDPAGPASPPPPPDRKTGEPGSHEET